MMMSYETYVREHFRENNPETASLLERVCASLETSEACAGVVDVVDKNVIFPAGICVAGPQFQRRDQPESRVLGNGFFSNICRDRIIDINTFLIDFYPA